MKQTILFAAAAALLICGCGKPEDKPAPVTKANETQKRPPDTRPSTLPPPEKAATAALDTPKVPPPTQAELDTFFADFDAFVKQADPLLHPPATGEAKVDYDALQKSWTTLAQRRSKLMSGMTIEQKKEIALRMRPAMPIMTALTQHRFRRMQETIRANAKRAPVVDPARPPAGSPPVVLDPAPQPADPPATPADPGPAGPGNPQ